MRHPPQLSKPKDANLAAGQNLSIGLLNTLEQTHEVPETRASLNRVGGKDLHLVDLGHLNMLGGLKTANNRVLVDLRCEALTRENFNKKLGPEAYPHRALATGFKQTKTPYLKIARLLSVRRHHVRYA